MRHCELEHLEIRRLLYAGQIDAAFPAKTVDPTGGADQVISVQRGPGDRIFVATDSGGKVSLTRLDADGTNAQTINTGISLTGRTASVAVDQASGLVAVAVPVVDTDPTEFISNANDHLIVSVFDFQTLGPLNSFDADGTRDIQFRNAAVHLAWQTDGKLVIGAEGDTSTEATTPDHDVILFLTRLNADGSTDTNFGTNGVVQITDDVGFANHTFQQRDLADLFATTDGKILVASNLAQQNSGTSVLYGIDLFRLNSNGQRDGGYGVNGRSALFQAHDDAFAANKHSVTFVDLDFQPNGAATALWVLHPSTSSTFTYHVSRAGSDGSLPSGSDVTAAMPGANFFADQVAAEAAGRVTIVGHVNNQSGAMSDTFAARFNADGSSDTLYANNGVFSGTEAGFFSTPAQSVLQSTGKLVIAGTAGSGAAAKIGLFRLQGGDGKPTVTLNKQGTLVATSYDGGDDTSLHVRASDGKLILNINGFAQSFTSSKVKRIAIYTAGGNDLVTIGPGIRGVYVEGGAGNDTLNGGQGDDVLLGGDGKDKIFGNDGNDKLLGGLGNDYLLGGAGKDDLFGNGNVDTLSGAGGNDRLFGGTGADRIIGGAGLDSSEKDDADHVASDVETILS